MEEYVEKLACIVYWEEEKEGYLRGKRWIRAKNTLLCADILLFSS